MTHFSHRALGVAPQLLVWTLPVLALAVAARIFLPELSAFEGKYRGVAMLVGLELVVLGVVFYIDLAIRLFRALRKNVLATGGSYALCRHPLYAWWVFFVFPAAAFLLNAWPFFLCSAALAIAVRRHGRTEESQLAEQFGDEYRNYRDRTRFLLPLPRFRGQGTRGLARLVFLGATVAVLGVTAYGLVVRPVMLQLGTTRAERAATYPGDDFVPTPRVGYTQAVTLDAPPEEVWAWLVQVGYRRAGWYNVDAINALAAPDYFFEGDGSAWRIIPELQEISGGDSITLHPQLAMTVADFEPGRTLLLTGGASGGTRDEASEDTPATDSSAGSSGGESSVVREAEGGTMVRPAGQSVVDPSEDESGAAMRTSWLFQLSPVAGGVPGGSDARESGDVTGDPHGSHESSRTRLVVRFRSDFPGGFGMFLANEIFVSLGGAVLQQQAMLHGLKERVEL